MALESKPVRLYLVGGRGVFAWPSEDPEEFWVPSEGKRLRLGEGLFGEAVGAAWVGRERVGKDEVEEEE